MAYATHLTIATGDRIRLRFPQDIGDEESRHGENGCQEENDIRQEVQVSITYALDGEETDLAAIATEKADEVKCAHEAAWHRIGAFSRQYQPLRASASSSCQAVGKQNVQPDDKQDIPHDDRQDAPRNDRQETLPVSGRQSPEQDGHSEQNGHQGNVHPAPLASPPISAPSIALPRNRAPAKSAARYVPAREYHRDDSVARPSTPQGGGDGGHAAASPVLEPVSQPQKILIRSLAQRIGLTPVNLEEMLWKQYQQRQLGQLTQPQAKAVIQALELCERSNRIAVEEQLPGSENQLTEAADQAEHGNEEMMDDNDWEVQEADMPHYA